MLATRLRQVLIAEAGVSFLLNDEFTSDEAAPITTPRTAEPGPGTLTITDTNEVMDIASSVLAINGLTATNDGIISEQFARTAGRGFFWKVASRTTITNTNRMGFDDGTLSTGDIEIGFDWSSTTAIRIKNAGSVLYARSVGAATQFLAVMRSTGGLLFYYTGTTWHLIHVYSTGTAALYAKAWISAATVNYTMDNWRVDDLPAPFNNDGLVTFSDADPDESDTFTHEADFVMVYTVDETDGSYEIRFRIQDASNYWAVTWNGTNTLQLVEVVATSPTTRGNNGSITPNAAARLVVIAIDEAIHINRQTGAPFNGYTSAANFKTETDASIPDETATITGLKIWSATMSSGNADILDLYIA